MSNENFGNTFTASKQPQWLKKIKKITKLILKLIFYKIILRAVFNFYALFPIRDKLVVFANYCFFNLPRNMEVIYRQCLEDGYDCVIFLKWDNKKNKYKLINMLAHTLKIVHFIKCYARCKALFVDAYYPPLYVNKPRKGTRVVQLWHACGVFKKFGYSFEEKNGGPSAIRNKLFPMHYTYTDVMVSSPDVIPYYAEAFRCDPDIIKPLGVPRSDIFFDPVFIRTAARKLTKIFPEIGKRKIILYAPTYRGSGNHGKYIIDIFDYTHLAEAIAGQYVLLTKYHPLTAKIINRENEKKMPDAFVYDVTNILTIEEAMCAADVLISDYSSLISEYSLLERPMIFFAYDLEQYNGGDRGFYFPYRDFVPGPIAEDMDSLIQAIINAELEINRQRIKVFRDKFMSACDGHSARRIYQEIFGKDQWSVDK